MRRTVIESRWASWKTAALVMATIWFAMQPVAAFGQDGSNEEGEWVVPDEAQKELNAKGVDALQRGDFDEAIDDFLKSLALGDTNLTRANLGRALARAGRCREAIEQYDEALRAPKVRTPAPEKVAAIVEHYREELQEMCPGELLITCSPPRLMIELDGKLAGRCGVEPLLLEPGKHVIVGVVDDKRSAEQPIEIAALQQLEIALEVDVPEPEQVVQAVAEPPAAEPAAEPEPAFSAWAIGGWASLGGGAVLFATAGALELFLLQPEWDDYEAAGREGDRVRYEDLRDSVETKQLVNQVLVIAGGAAVLTGATLLIVDLVSDGADAEPATMVMAPWVAHDAAGMSWRAAW